MILKILLSGDGGQGIQLMADIICKVSVNNDWQVSAIPNYGLEQRGGVSLSFVQISDKPIGYPKFTEPNILLFLSPQAEERTKIYQLKNSENIKILNIEYYKNILDENKILTNSYNIFFLGVIAKMLEEKKICRKEEMFDLIRFKLEKKLGWEENKRAFEMGSK
jgi:Pyruvate/2-oxoacid:ferredoxin oxidoreductase gamma subunit